MNVLLVTTSYPLREEAVSGIFVKKLVNQLNNFVNITVVTPGDDKVVTDDAVKCAKYAPRKLQRLTHRPGGIPVALKSNPFTWLLLPPLLASIFFQCLAQSRDKDAVIANWSINGVIAGLAAKLFNIPLITILRGSDVNTDPGKGKVNIVLWVAIKLSTNVVCVSEHFYREMLSNYSKDKEKFIMIPNGVDTEFFDITPSVSSGSLRLVTVANLNPKKGVHNIVEACGILRHQGIPVELTVIGDGPDKGRLESLAQSSGISEAVHFVGAVTHGEIRNYLEKTDAFVFASYAEGRANVLLEAMASSLPIIASDIEANKELICHGENGFLFQTGNSDDLALKLSELLSSKTLRLRMGLSAREYMVRNELSWPATGEKYNKLLLSSVRPQ